MLCRRRSGEQLSEESRPKRKGLAFFSRMRRENPYEKMREEAKKRAEQPEPQEKKKKKKTWKRVRQAALTTCRYIGLGAAGMTPTIYCSPEYSMDPKHWNRSFGSSKSRSSYRAPPPPGHMFGWC